MRVDGRPRASLETTIGPDHGCEVLAEAVGRDLVEDGLFLGRPGALVVS